MASYTYLPWVRQGLIGAVGSGTVTGGRLALTVAAIVSGGGSGTTTPVDVLLFGAGDVTGFDVRQVIRTDPPHLTSDYEPNYFPVVEFDRPDFPWLATPAAPDTRNQLTPWICLIVVERRDGVQLDADGTRPLPILTIAAGAFKELPDLSEAWAWAHAQVGAVADPDDLDAALTSQSERTLSRLMCPRRLKPRTAYIACVVPTFKGGVQAGLGDAVVSAEVLEKAWTLGANQPETIRLPVYYSWEFATGLEGDFEALVWQLERRRLTLNEVGARKLEIGLAGYGLPATAPVDLEGALGPEASEGDAPVGPSQPYRDRLQGMLNETTAVQPLPVLPPPMYGRWHALQRSIPDPIAPGKTRDRAWLRSVNLDPRYRVAAGIGAQVVREQQEQLMAAAWDQVGEIERANQMLRQALLAREASRVIHQERLGGLNETAFLMASSPAQPRVRYRGGPSGETRTAYGHVRRSALPAAITSVQLRRALRPRGATARRFGVATVVARETLVSRLNASQISAAPRQWPVPRSMFTMDSVLDRSPCRTDPSTLARALLERYSPAGLRTALDHVISAIANHQAEIATFSPAMRAWLERVAKNGSVARDRLASFIARSGRPGADYLELVLSLCAPALALIGDLRWIVARITPSFGATPPQSIEDVNTAANELPPLDELRNINFDLALMRHLQKVEPCEQPLRPPKPPLDLAELKQRVHAQFNPAITIAARVRSLVRAPDWTADDLDVVMAAPEFPAPMYRSLVSLSQDWLLPGLERVPRNTLAILQTNPRFIEAYMVGLNHEMSRELLWRGYPTDQRGTYFRQFWDPSGRFVEAADAVNVEQGKDIPPLHQWGDGALGTHSGATAPSQLVLLIRGDLLRRYARAMIYLARAEWSKDGNNKVPPRKPTAVEKHPIFRAELEPDIQLLGFDIDPQSAAGTEQPSTNPQDDGAGWFVVIQQQPTEPRFGLDETPATSPDRQWTWRDLSWAHVNLTREEGYVALGAGLTPAFPVTAQRGAHDEEWAWTPTNAPGDPQPDAAQIACITLQSAVRVAVHASDLI